MFSDVGIIDSRVIPLGRLRTAVISLGAQEPCQVIVLDSMLTTISSYGCTFGSATKLLWMLTKWF